MNWLPVVGYEGLYEVSDAGLVRSVFRLTVHGKRYQPRVLKPQADRKGYQRVGLSRDGQRQFWKVHHLVLLTFTGLRPVGAEACHGDGDKANNAAANLRWDTPSSNALDNVRLGVHPQTRKTHCVRGHEFTPENTRHGSYGRWRSRTCRICSNRRCAEYRARKAAA